MKVVYKYTLAPVPLQFIMMPSGAQRVHFDTQAGRPTLWALLNADLPLSELTVESYATGEPLREPTQLLDHLGSAAGPEGHVRHYFIRIDV